MNKNNKNIEPWTDRFDMIITHGNCRDGSCCANVLRTSKTEIVYYMHSASTFPDVTNRRVIIVDLAPKSLEHASELYCNAKELIVLDHHATSLIMKDLPFTYINMKYAGCQLAYAYRYNFLDKLDYSFATSDDEILINDTTVKNTNIIFPWWVDYTADRDLWTWNLRYSREISKALDVKRMNTMDGIEKLKNIEPGDEEWMRLVEIGSIVLENDKSLFKCMAKTAVSCQMDCGIYGMKNVLIAQSPYPLISDYGEFLYSRKNKDGEFESDFVVLYNIDSENSLINFSLRCNKESNVDVSKIAQLYGGGGHPCASGFSIKYVEAYADFNRKDVLPFTHIFTKIV